MKLTLGPTDVGEWGVSDPCLELSNADVPLLRLPLAVLSQPITGELLDRLPEVDELVVGYLDPPDLDYEFLRLAPQVTRVLIYPPIKQVEWLRPLKRLQTLAISRSVKHLKVLPELTSLENISFPGWPSGA